MDRCIASTVPRQAAAVINPMIADTDYRGTLYNVADAMMHLADALAQSRANSETPPELYPVFNLLAAALRYEHGSGAVYEKGQADGHSRAT